MSLELLLRMSGRTAFRSMAASAAASMWPVGSSSDSLKSAPRSSAGVMGQPQFLERGGPELAGPRGMSPSSTFKPGKVGLLASG